MFDPRQNIITLLGIEGLPEAKRLAIVEKAADLVEQRVSMRLMERLDEASLAEAERLAADPERLAAFFARRVPELGAITHEEIMRVRSELAAVADAADVA